MSGPMSAPPPPSRTVSAPMGSSRRRRADVGSAAAFANGIRADGFEQTADLFGARQRGSAGAHAKTHRLFGAAIHFDGGHIIVYLVADHGAIGASAGRSVFFVGPEHHAQRAPRMQSQFLDADRGFRRGQDAPPIVLRARAPVP